jgi:Lon protease-like protein
MTQKAFADAIAVDRTLNIPLFPLNTVLFPGARLPLRIFERRYLDMVSSCLRSETPFGVVLIREGLEVGEAARTFDTGTLAHIVDWEPLPDGLLGVTAHGGERFVARRRRVEPNQLLTAEVSTIPEQPAESLPPRFQSLAALVGRLLSELQALPAKTESRLDDAVWVSWRLAELLPLSLAEKQSLLELPAASDRLTEIQSLLDELLAKSR